MAKLGAQQGKTQGHAKRKQNDIDDAIHDDVDDSTLSDLAVPAVLSRLQKSPG